VVYAFPEFNNPFHPLAFILIYNEFIDFCLHFRNSFYLIKAEDLGYVFLFVVGVKVQTVEVEAVRWS